MNTPHPHLFDLQRLVVQLAQIKRNHYLAGTEQHENDIEHSYMVALLSWFIIDNQSLSLDIAAVLKYALCHDFVEVYAGDINTFASADDRKQKRVNETRSLKRLSEELYDFPDLIDCMKAYEDKADDETLFVWTVDKMQALIMGDLDAWRPYQELPVDTSHTEFRTIPYDEFVSVHSAQLKKASPYAREIYDGLLQYCKTTYYDKPGKD